MFTGRLLRNMNNSKYVDEFLKYVLKRAKESYMENPFPSSKEKNILTSEARKKLEQIAEVVKGEDKK